jgi:hypothetical protein
MQAYNKKAQQVVQLQRTTPIPRQLLSMALDLGYPTVTQGHRLTDLTPIARTKQFFFAKHRLAIAYIHVRATKGHRSCT